MPIFCTKIETKLNLLDIMRNDIKDDVCDAITEAMKRNTSLSTLKMQGNPINERAAIAIVQALQYNNTLKVIGLPKYNREAQKQIETFKEEVNVKRNQTYRRPQLLKEIKYS